jgi:hypothetical protein
MWFPPTLFTIQTHAALRELSSYTDLSPAQARGLIRAANRNSQIYWIRSDPDVREFFTGIAEEYADFIDENELAEF